jgi:hypothetical protein
MQAPGLNSLLDKRALVRRQIYFHTPKVRISWTYVNSGPPNILSLASPNALLPQLQQECEGATPGIVPQ